jgi:glutaredoxin-related protein
MALSPTGVNSRLMAIENHIPWAHISFAKWNKLPQFIVETQGNQQMSVNIIGSKVAKALVMWLMVTYHQFTSCGFSR